MLYVMIPANSLARTAIKLKKVLHTKVVLDIIDMWPESLPVKGVETLWPLRCWRRLRDDNLGHADLVFTECGLYKKASRIKARGGSNSVLAKGMRRSVSVYFRRMKIGMHVAYLGSVK